jgi:hypothetical protein
MKYRSLCSTVVAGVALATFGFGPAFAQQPDVSPAELCEAAAASYQTYAGTTNDPDKPAADARVAEGLTDCKNDDVTHGLGKINEGMVMVHDRTTTKIKK